MHRRIPFERFALSQRREAAVEIVRQILDIFEPDRKAEHALADSELAPGLFGETLMRGRRGMRDEALASPRLFEILMIWKPFATLKAAARLPLTSKAMRFDPPDIWRWMMSACGWSARPG